MATQSSTENGQHQGGDSRLLHSPIMRANVNGQAAFSVRNPANTFDYSIIPSAIAAGRNLTIPLLTAADVIAVLNLAQTFSKVQTIQALDTEPFIVDRIGSEGEIADFRAGSNSRLQLSSAASAPQITIIIGNASSALIAPSVAGANTNAGGYVTVRGGVGGTTGGIGGPVKIEGGAAGGGNVDGGRVQLTTGAKAGTGLKPIVEIDGSGAVPTTAQMDASYLGLRLSGSDLLAYGNIGGVIKSITIGTLV